MATNFSSCLENPVDRGAWWAAVRGVARVRHDWSNLLHRWIQSSKQPLDMVEYQHFLCISRRYKFHKPCVLAGSSLLCVYSSQNTAAIWMKMSPWGVEEVISPPSVGTCPSGFHPTAPFSRLPFKFSTDTLPLSSHYTSIFPLFPASLISFCESRLKTLSSAYALCLLHVFQPND